MAGKTILIVDDNPINLKFIQVMLAAEGYQVQQAKDAETALQLIQTSPPDLILTDVQLPGMDGLEFTRRLKAGSATSHIKIIALTAYSMIEDEAQARLAGCDDYIIKPFSANLLSARIAHHLGKN